MIPRTPVPATKPECFGTGYEPTHLTCQDCTQRRICTAEADQWATRRSLAEQVRQPPPAPLDSTPPDPEALYAAIYQKHYGFDPFVERTFAHRKRIATAKACVAKAAVYCAAQGLDFALFVTAQMHAFRVAQQNTLRTMRYFPANWLSGPGAERRYHVHGAKARRQFRRVRADAFDHHTAWGHLRTRLLDDETDIAGLYCTGVRFATEDWSYARAVAEADPSVEWHAVATQGKHSASAIRAMYRDLCKTFRADTVADLHRHARWHAAYAVAEQTQHRLADRLHLTEDWTWEDFAAMLVRVGGALRESRPTHTPDGLRRLGGRLWGARA